MLRRKIALSFGGLAAAAALILPTTGCTPFEWCQTTKPHDLDRVYSAAPNYYGDINCSADHFARRADGSVYNTGIDHHWTVQI